MNCNLPAAQPFSFASGQAVVPGRQQMTYQGAAAYATQAAISLTTAEGDVVTIQSSRQESYAMAAGFVSTPAKHLQSYTLAGLSQETFSLSVDGDLNEQELADINRLVGELTAVAGDFFNGDREKALAGALSLGDMGSISHLQASFIQSSTMVQEATSRSSGPLAVGHHGFSEQDRQLPSAGDVFDYHAILQAQWRQVKEWLEEETAGLGGLSRSQEPGPLSDGEPGQSDLPTVAGRNRVEPAEAAEVAQAGAPLAAGDTLGAAARGASAPLRQPASLRMLELIKETMISHPRLTPLAGALAELAVDSAAAERTKEFPLEQNRTLQAAAELKENFGQRLNDWLLT